MTSITIQQTPVTIAQLPPTTATDAPALGTNAKSASGGSKASDNRAMRWSLQGQGKKLLPKERVATCYRYMLDHAQHVEVQYVARTGSAHYAGLQTCGSVWMCPICASKITERRKLEVEKAVKGAKEIGYRVIMLTYTFRHKREDNLKEQLVRMAHAFKLMNSGDASQARRAKYSVLGTIRALEVTHSEWHGWHPHTHVLMFVPNDTDIESLESEYRTAWKESAAKAGLDMDVHGFHLESCNDKVANYIAKYGTEPSEKTLAAYDKGWNESSELTKWQLKGNNNVSRAYNEHVTPFGLLRYSLEGDETAGHLFIEYALAFKHRRQLVWSPGLKEKFGINEKTDEELAEEQEEEAITLVQLSPTDWKKVLGNDCRGELLEIARTGNIDVIKQFLEDIGIHVMQRE